MLESAPPLIQESFIDQFSSLLDWEQTQILSVLQRLASMMNTPALSAESILVADPLINTPNKIKESSKLIA
jgi:hypothetical protein